MNNSSPLPLAGCEVLPPLVVSPATSPAKAKSHAATEGRFQSINAFCDQTLAGLSRAEAAIWLVLWRDTKRNGLARVSQANLAKRAGVSQRTVRRALLALRRKGLVIVVYQGGLSRGPSTYRVFPLVNTNREDAGGL